MPVSPMALMKQIRSAVSRFAADAFLVDEPLGRLPQQLKLQMRRPGMLRERILKWLMFVFVENLNCVSRKLDSNLC